MAIYKCKMCGASLKYEEGKKVLTCEYCGCVQSLSGFGDKNIDNLFNRGSELMRSCNFDAAAEKFENILDSVNDNPEVYWNLLMCHFGVTYEKDPVTLQMVPTIHRTQDYSIYLDNEYKNAIEYSNGEQKEYYEKTAKYIDNIQKKYNDIISEELPYDIFICYKQQDSNKDTEDYKIAYELYNSLSDCGFKVFFSHISLEDKIGEEYEPYIYAALRSSKVMISIGTKNKYYESVWVKNEWHRFLLMMKEDKNKWLIPLCSKAKDLPIEFSRLQAVQMNNNIVWKEDLIRYIKKIFINYRSHSDLEQNNTFKSINDELKKGYTSYVKINSEDIRNRANNDVETSSKGINKATIIVIVLGIVVLALTLYNSLFKSDIEEVANYEETETYEVIEEASVDLSRRIVKTEIRIRDNSSQSGKIVGHVYLNDVIDVLDSVNNEGYTWYKIGENQWVADNGYWTETYDEYSNTSNIYLNSYNYIGAMFYFGKYEQDNNSSNGTEDIYWRVIGVDNDRILVISEYALDSMKFNDTFTDWKTSNIRKWLNEDFIYSSFNTKEIAKIISVTNTTELNNEKATEDRVFLLSMNEINLYMPDSNDRICYPTEYAVSKGAHQYGSYEPTWWWLRSMNSEYHTVLNIRTTGDLRYVDAAVNSDGYCVRPAMWLSLK